MYVAPCGEQFGSIPDKLKHYIQCSKCKKAARERNEALDLEAAFRGEEELSRAVLVVSAS